MIIRIHTLFFEFQSLIVELQKHSKIVLRFKRMIVKIQIYFFGFKILLLRLKFELENSLNFKI